MKHAQKATCSVHTYRQPAIETSNGSTAGCRITVDNSARQETSLLRAVGGSFLIKSPADANSMPSVRRIQMPLESIEMKDEGGDHE